jgi:hypothetical protein
MRVVGMLLQIKDLQHLTAHLFDHMKFLPTSPGTTGDRCLIRSATNYNGQLDCNPVA